MKHDSDSFENKGEKAMGSISFDAAIQMIPEILEKQKAIEEKLSSFSPVQPQKRYLTHKEAAEYIRRNPGTLYQYVNAGLVPSANGVYDINDLDTFMEYKKSNCIWKEAEKMKPRRMKKKAERTSSVGSLGKNNEEEKTNG
jgi:hypothetical protein